MADLHGSGGPRRRLCRDARARVFGPCHLVCAREFGGLEPRVLRKHASGNDPRLSRRSSPNGNRATTVQYSTSHFGGTYLAKGKEAPVVCLEGSEENADDWGAAQVGLGQVRRLAAAGNSTLGHSSDRAESRVWLVDCGSCRRRGQMEMRTRLGIQAAIDGRGRQGFECKERFNVGVHNGPMKRQMRSQRMRRVPTLVMARQTTSRRWRCSQLAAESRQGLTV